MSMEHEHPYSRSSPDAGSHQTRRRTGTAKGGRYLKEQPKKSRNNAHRSHRGHRSRRRRKLNPRFVILVVGLLAILIGIILGVRSCSKPTIIGRWDVDGTTVYEFDKNGKGALVLMTTEYEFNYVIEGDVVRIDFVDDAALDAAYTFNVQKNVLFLTGGPGDAKTDYVLRRIG